MKQDTHLVAACRVPKWSTPADARDRLDREIDGFVMAAVEGSMVNDEDCPALALKVTAGLGKTETALRVIARHAKPLLERGHVLIYVPTLALAEQACEDFHRLAPGTPCRVVRGRNALWPEDRERQMCARADLATKVSGFVPSVTQALCRAKDREGNVVQSDCADGCPYLHQKDSKGAHVVFLSHAYLTVYPPVDSDVNIAIRVVDEKFWPSLVRTARIPVDEYMRAPPTGFPDDLRGLLSMTKAAILDGLQRNLPLHDHLTSADVTDGMLEQLATAERGARVNLDIGPWQSPQALEFCVKTFDTKAFVASRRREKIFSRLAEKTAGHCNGLTITDTSSDTVTRQAIEMASLDAVPRDAPLLLLDADADPQITERVVPGAAFICIESPPIADIVQVSDRTLSDSWLLDDDNGPTRRAAVLTILQREVTAAAGGGVLLVATKAVLKALHDDVGQPHHADEKLRHPLIGAEPRWFGPRMQGVNDYKDHATVVIVGRLQPGIPDVEASARAVYGHDDAPIATHGTMQLPPRETQQLMADGTTTGAVVRTHPDARVHSILAQTRECGTLQAIARLRLVSPNRAKRVVILSNLPLPGFPATRTVSLEALEQDLEAEVDVRGFNRIEAAFRATMGRQVRGTRLSVAGLAEDLPLNFDDRSAKHFRRGRPTKDLLALCQRVAAANGWPLTACNLRRDGGGKPVPAVVLAPRSLAMSQAHKLWPGYAIQTI